MELLDTEGDEGDDEDMNEEVVEVEKWSEYVDKYINAGPAEVSVEIKEMLLKRPVFLTRSAHVLKHKFGVLNSADPGKKESTKETSSSNESAKPNESETKESKDENKFAEEGAAAVDKPPKTEADTAKDGEEVRTESRAKESKGSVLDDLIVQENTVVKFQLNSLRPKHGVNSTSLMYRRNSLKLARKVRTASRVLLDY